MELSPAISGMFMPAIGISAGANSPAASCSEWQSARDSANPHERSHAAATDDTHNNSAAKKHANMRLIFTAETRCPAPSDALGRASPKEHVNATTEYFRSATRPVHPFASRSVPRSGIQVLWFYAGFAKRDSNVAPTAFRYVQFNPRTCTRMTFMSVALR